MPSNEYDAVMLHLNENLLLDETEEQDVVDGLSLNDLHRYPPGGDRVFRQAVAQACDVSPETILPSAGATHAIQYFLMRFVPQFRRVILPSPTWAFYATCISSLGGEITE